MTEPALHAVPDKPSLRSRLSSLLVNRGMILTARQSAIDSAAEIKGKVFTFETDELYTGSVRSAQVTCDGRLRIWVECADIAFFESSPMGAHHWTPHRLHHSGQYIAGMPGTLLFN